MAALSRTAMRTLRASARTSSSVQNRAFSAELAEDFRENITSDRLIPAQVVMDGFLGGCALICSHLNCTV